MADYYVYKYEFKPSLDRPLEFKDENGNKDEFTPELLRKKFGDCFPLRGKPDFFKEKDGEWIPLQSYVEAHRDEVIVLTLCTSELVKYYKPMDNQPTDLESNPNCRIIIDNRKEAMQILIEKRSEFKGGPDAAMKIVKSYINEKFLGMLPFEVETFAKYDTDEVWRHVEENRKRKIFVRKISFTFKDSGQTDLQGTKEHKLWKTIAKLNQTLGAAQSQFISQANGRPGGLNFSRAVKDCKNLVNILGRNGYKLKIDFYKKAPSFSVGDGENGKGDYQVTVGLNEIYVGDFINGGQTFENSFDLIEYLDKIRKTNGKFKPFRPNPKKRR